MRLVFKASLSPRCADATADAWRTKAVIVRVVEKNVTAYSRLDNQNWTAKLREIVAESRRNTRKVNERRTWRTRVGARNGRSVGLDWFAGVPGRSPRVNYRAE